MTTDALRWGLAALAVLAWLALTGVSLWRARRKPAEAVGRDAVLVAFASQTGFGEELAEMTARSLVAAGADVATRGFDQLTLEDLRAARKVLFIASTTGEGDAPDGAARFVRQAMTSDSDLPGLEYGLLALGDHKYRDFCAFGRALDGWLRRSGAQPLFDPVEVDNGEAGAIRHWQHQLSLLTGTTAQPDWAPPAYDRWRLVERIHINPGSPGGEAWRLAFEPIDHTPEWRAGDIAEIGVPGPTGEPSPGSREYSIASLPADGRLELLVRLMFRPDGSPGLASGWLARQAVVGDEVAMRIRTNRSFHGPETSRPVILIGNGTGIAGLRAHLKARAAAGARDAWLLFGERTAAHDRFFAADLEGWRNDGTLTRCDLAFSRDQADRVYVQHLVARERAEIVRWLDRGAVVLVCGSLEGMAAGVHAALSDAIGADRLAALTEAGLYRRDVY